MWVTGSGQGEMGTHIRKNEIASWMLLSFLCLAFWIVSLVLVWTAFHVNFYQSYPFLGFQLPLCLSSWLSCSICCRCWGKLSSSLHPHRVVSSRWLCWVQSPVLAMFISYSFVFFYFLESSIKFWEILLWNLYCCWFTVGFLVGNSLPREKHLHGSHDCSHCGHSKKSCPIGGELGGQKEKASLRHGSFLFLKDIARRNWKNVLKVGV